MSKRFALKKYLGLTEDEIVENEQMWRQENGEQDTQLDPESDMSGLGAVGVQPMDPNMMQPMEAEPLPGEDPMAPGPGGVARADGSASPITGNEQPGGPGGV